MENGLFEKLLLQNLRVVTYEKGCIDGLTDQNLTAAITVNENLKSLGFTLSPRDIGLLAVSPSRDGLYHRIRAFLPDVKADPMYPDFPEQVMEMDEAQFRLHQALHYFSTYGIELLLGTKVSRGWLPDVEKTPKSMEDTRLLEASVVELCEAEKACFLALERILGKKERMSLPEKELVLLAFPQVTAEELSGIKVPFKENIRLLFADILDTFPRGDALRILSCLCQHTGDVLNNIEPVMRARKYHFRTSEKKLLVKLLECYPVQDFRNNLILSDKKRERNLTILKHLDYNLYSRSVPHRQAVSDLRSGNLISWEGMLNRKLEAGEPDALAFASSRPGMVVRMLSRLLVLGYAEADIAENVAPNAAALSARTLVKVLSVFRSGTEETIRSEWENENRSVRDRYSGMLRNWDLQEAGWRHDYTMRQLEWAQENLLNSRERQAEDRIRHLSDKGIHKIYLEKLSALTQPATDAASQINHTRNERLSDLRKSLSLVGEKLRVYDGMTASWERLCADGKEASGGYALLARKQAEFAAARKGNLQKRQKELQDEITFLQEENDAVSRRILEEDPDLLRQMEELKERYDSMKTSSAEIKREIREDLAKEEEHLREQYSRLMREEELRFEKETEQILSHCSAETARIHSLLNADLARVSKKYTARLGRLQTLSARKRIIMDFLEAHFAKVSTPLRGKKVYLDPGRFDLDHSCLEGNDRSQDSTYIPSGFCWKIPEDARRVRFFVYWNDQERVDVDLHAGAVRKAVRFGKEVEEQVHVGWNADYNKCGVTHSGDITHSDAAEYIDVDLSSDLDRVYLNVNLFSGKASLADISECYIGLMAVDKTWKNVKQYSPANCFFSHEIYQKTGRLFYGYLDVKERYVRFVGKPDFTSLYSGMIDTDPDRNFFVREYLDLVIKGQEASWCSSLEEADVLLTVDKSSIPGAISLIDEKFFLDAV